MGKMRTCGPADRLTGKLWTTLADRIRILPMCIASCHRPRAQRRTNYLVGPRLHTCHGSLVPSLPSLTFLPPLLRGSSPVPSPFPSLPLAEPQQKSNLVHFSVKMWYLVAQIPWWRMTCEGYNTVDMALLFYEKISQQINFCLVSIIFYMYVCRFEGTQLTEICCA